ncbi:MAG: CZB domain-containing protein [Bacteroidetes bacterium]|nr:CZB domain-containing protein [Bacteroidota bacterium]
MNDHIQYMMKIIATLKNDGSFQGSDPHMCRFGIWYYGVAKDEILSLNSSEAVEIFNSLEAIHTAFHLAGEQGLNSKNKGDQNGVEKAISDLSTLSNQIVTKFLQLDKF